MTEQVNTNEILNQIITDRRYISAMDYTGTTVDLMVRGLTPDERLRAEFIYKQSIAVGRRQRLLSQKQHMSDAISKGLWTEEKERLIKLYEAEIKQLEKQRNLYSSSPNKGKQIKFNNDIIKARKKLTIIEDERHSYSSNSLESYASQTRSNFIVGRMVLDISGNSLWSTHEDFLEERDTNFLHNILGAIGRQTEKSERDIRRVARSPQWSIMWSCSKKLGESLFGKPSTQYTSEQSLLCYWAMMYDNVYESLERPSDKIIDDDEALDQWFIDQREEQAKDRKKKRATSKMDKHPEVFIMANTDEEADEIWELNNEWTLSRLQEEAKVIEEKGSISEYKLRRNQIKRDLQLSNSGKFAEARREQAKPRGFA